MDVKSFLKRAVLIALVSALPTFVSVASAHGGGHGSGGSSGSGASSGGHGSGGGHSASGSNSGHSSSGSNSGSSSSVSKGGHSTSDPSTAPATAVSGRSVSASSVHSSTVRSRPEPVVHHFSTGGGHGDWQEGEKNADWRRHNGRRLFGFIRY